MGGPQVDTTGLSMPRNNLGVVVDGRVYLARVGVAGRDILTVMFSKRRMAMPDLAASFPMGQRGPASMGRKYGAINRLVANGALARTEEKLVATSGREALGVEITPIGDAIARALGLDHAPLPPGGDGQRDDGDGEPGQEREDASGEGHGD